MVNRDSRGRFVSSSPAPAPSYSAPSYSSSYSAPSYSSSYSYSYNSYSAPSESPAPVSSPSSRASAQPRGSDGRFLPSSPSPSSSPPSSSSATPSRVADVSDVTEALSAVQIAPQGDTPAVASPSSRGSSSTPPRAANGQFIRASAALAPTSSSGSSSAEPSGSSSAEPPKRTLTQQLRKPYSQKVYREDSSSQNPSEQHVAHIVSLSMVASIQSLAPGPAAVDALREVFNSPDNLKMVLAKTNLVTHKKQDQALEAKYHSGEPLTQREEVRAREMVGVYQRNQVDIPPGQYDAARKFFKALNTSDGTTLWDARKDTD